MKIVVIGETSQLGSKVVTILKQNASRTVTTKSDKNVDTVSRDCSPKQASITGEAATPSSGSPGCSGKNCARCSSCAAIDRLIIADLEIRRTDEPAVRDADGDAEARYGSVRLADLRLLPDYRAIRNATPFVGWSTSLPSPRKK